LRKSASWRFTISAWTPRPEASGQAPRSVRLVIRRSYPRREVVERLADIICAMLPDTVRPVRR
jgi:hypothetical protein